MSRPAPTAAPTAAPDDALTHALRRRADLINAQRMRRAMRQTAWTALLAVLAAALRITTGG